MSFLSFGEDEDTEIESGIEIGSSLKEEEWKTLPNISKEDGLEEVISPIRDSQLLSETKSSSVPLDDVIEKRGKPITCKYCFHQFRFELKSEKIKWRETKLHCPSCNIDYCVLPPTERDLQLIQEKYIDSNKQEKYLYEIYLTLNNYARSIIKKRFSNVVHSKEDLDWHSYNSAMLIIEMYLAIPDCKIRDSFGGLLYDKIRESLWKKEEHLIEDLSINRVFSEEEKTQFEIRYDCQNLENVNSLLENNSIIDTVIDNIVSYNIPKEDKKYNLKRLVAVNAFLNNSKLDSDIYKYLGNSGSIHFTNTIQLLKEKLYELAKA